MARTKQTVRRNKVPVYQAAEKAAAFQESLSLPDKEKERVKKIALIKKNKETKAKKTLEKAKKVKKDTAERKKMRACAASSKELSRELRDIAPTAYQIQKLTRERYKVLRAEVSETLNKIRKHTYKC